MYIWSVVMTAECFMIAVLYINKKVKIKFMEANVTRLIGIIEDWHDLEKLVLSEVPVTIMFHLH